MREDVAYSRVSTQEQGRSGLGVEAQAAALQRFAEQNAFDIIATFTEIGTRKGANALDRRPKLKAALSAARKVKGPVLVAKLDRRSRVRFMSGLMAQGVPFIDVDVPVAHLRGPGREGTAVDLRTHQGRGWLRRSSGASTSAG